MSMLPTETTLKTGTILRLEDRSLAWKIGAVVLGSLLLTLASKVQVPMYPVPMTMQTMAVGLVGALYGWRLGALTVVVWLAQGLAGLPVLAGMNVGPAYFMGPTGGYLAAFPFAAAFAGWMAERGWGGHNVVRSFLAQLGQNALTLVIGGVYLATLIGPEKAIMAGVLPFVLGAVLKSALAAAILKSVGLGLARSDAR